jgi:DnaJ-domain-containing protein 1
VTSGSAKVPPPQAAGQPAGVIDGIGPRTLVPKPVKGIDWQKQPLDAREGYVLTRVDGFTSVGDICAMVALPDTPAILRRLVDLGLITIEGVARRPVAPAATPRTPTPAGTPRMPTPAATPKAPTPAAGTKPAASGPSAADHEAEQARIQAFLDTLPVDESLLEAPGVDLDADRRRQILALHAALPFLNYWELLGLARGASKAEIKRAYFRLSKTFHPDQYFRKQLGPFLERISSVFAQLSRAYETLGDDTLRAQYDLALKQEASSSG